MLLSGALQSYVDNYTCEVAPLEYGMKNKHLKMGVIWEFEMR